MSQFPTFLHVLEVLDGRKPDGMTLYEIVTKARWKKRPSKTEVSEYAITACFTGIAPGLAKLEYRTEVGRNKPWRLPWHSQLRVKLIETDPLFGGNLEFVFLEASGKLECTIGVHKGIFFTPLSGQRGFSFDDGFQMEWNETLLPLFKKRGGWKALLAECPKDQMLQALLLLQASTRKDRRYKLSLTPFCSREEASRRLAEMIRNTSFGD